jgi:cytochrome c oxidase subunit 1
MVLRALRAVRSTDHKTVGLLYALAALSCVFFGFCIMLVMRWQLAYPGTPLPLVGGWFGTDHRWLPNGVMLPEFYNQLAGMHGTIMIFLAVVPLMVGGFGTYLVPLMLGARGVAFPRLSRFGFWCYAAGAATILSGFFVQSGPANSGWTGYPPLSTIDPLQLGQTLWLVGLVGVYLSSLILSINLLVTIVQHRAPGMGFLRMPFFVWSQGVTALLLLLAFPPLAAAAAMQLMDRLAGTSFFMPSGLVVGAKAIEVAGGGSALLWQHLFWFLAHPEVYVMLLPAFGIVAEVITTNARRPLWGYRGMVYSILALAVFSMLVWAHHMYLTGMADSLSSFFQTTTVIISLPSVIIATSLVATLWGGRLRFPVPMCFALAFLPMFGVGGLTGLPLAMRATNTVLHDTYYVIGHFHYVVAPGILFAAFAGVYHWFPKVTGRRLNTLLGHLHLWPSLLFMNGIFLSMIVQGINGVSRRLYDGGAMYAHGIEVAHLNVIATHSAFGLLLAQVPFLINFAMTLARRAQPEQNPWESTSLEWTAPTPPLPAVNFTTPPRVYRAAYAYDASKEADDFLPQAQPESNA